MNPAIREAKLADLEKRIQTVLNCPGGMCGHCIEVLTGEISADEKLDLGEMP